MGNNSSTNVTIKFDQLDSSFFAGEVVSGTVTLDLHEQEIKVHKIFMTLEGKIGYATRRIMSNGKGGISFTTEYHHVPFFSAKTIFIRSYVGEKKLIYNRGQYSWPFQIQLTDYLPPTINNPSGYPRVQYCLKFVVVKPWHNRNIKHTEYLTIFPRVNLLQYPPCLLTSTFDNHSRQDILVKVILNKFGFVPGEMIAATLEITNPQRIVIKYIALSMIEYDQIATHIRRYSVFKVILPKIINLADEQIKEIFYLIVPTTPLVPSYQYSGGIKRTTNVNVRYSLKFKVKVKGLFTNFDISVPIILGTEPIPDTSQQQALDPTGHFISFDPGKGMFKDDSLPSYDLFFHVKENSHS